MQIKALKICSLFFKLSLIWLIIDAINGFFMASGINIPISPLFKIFIMFLLALGLLKQRGGIEFVWFIAIYVTYLIIHLTLNTVSPQLGTTVNHLFRFIISVLIYFFVVKYTQLYPSWSYHSINKIFKVSTIVVVVNVLIGLLGLGYSAYGGNIGNKGYFNAGNELSGVVMILFPFTLYTFGLKYGTKNFKYISTTILLLITVALMGTKTALLVMLFTIPIIPQLYKKRTNFVKIGNILIISVSILSIILYHILDYYGMMDRWLWIYERGGIEQIIFSGRDKFWQEEKMDFFNANVYIQLFGLGESRTVEMDPFDALLNYGYVGVLLCYSFYIYLLVKSWKYRNINMIAKLVLYVNILILGASTFAGHIIFSGMASWLIALINTLIYIPNNILLNKQI